MSFATLEAEISPGMSTTAAVALGRRVEEAGFDRLGISDVLHWPDCFVLQALIADATERVHIGSMVTNPYTRHPAVLAGMLATLQDVSGGRMFCGIGVGAGLEDLGIDYPRPVRALREAVTAMRALLAGESVELDGEMFPVSGELLRPPSTPVPISIGTRSAQVMQLAGELADVALVGARNFTPELAAQYRGWLADGAERVGRDPADVEVAPRLTLCVSDDAAHARASIIRYVAHYLAIIRPVELDPERLAEIEAALERSTGWYFDLDRHDDPALVELVPEEWITRYAVVGTPAEVVDQMAAIADLGFTSASLNLAAVVRSDMETGLRETIDGFAGVIDDVRAL
ncbi:MAG: LLM class flavin-dependent oxidoreductase [Actinomycetota bacterium]